MMLAPLTRSVPSTCRTLPVLISSACVNDTLSSFESLLADPGRIGGAKFHAAQPHFATKLHHACFKHSSRELSQSLKPGIAHSASFRSGALHPGGFQLARFQFSSIIQYSTSQSATCHSAAHVLEKASSADETSRGADKCSDRNGSKEPTDQGSGCTVRRAEVKAVEMNSGSEIVNECSGTAACSVSDEGPSITLSGDDTTDIKDAAEDISNHGATDAAVRSTPIPLVINGDSCSLEDSIDDAESAAFQQHILEEDEIMDGETAPEQSRATEAYLRHINYKSNVEFSPHSQVIANDNGVEVFMPPLMVPRRHPQLTREQMIDIQNRVRKLEKKDKLKKQQLGKHSLRRNLLLMADNQLAKTQFLKVRVLPTSELDVTFVKYMMETYLDCVCVKLHGRTIVLYRQEDVPRPKL